MSVCVIIPALRPEGTLAVLERVEADCTSAVVVDNARGAVGRAVRREAPWATVLTPKSNIGFGAAVQLAADHADEDYILLINDDVVPRPGFVPHMLEPFSDPNVHQVAGCLFVEGSTRVDSVGLAFDRVLRCENVHRVRFGAPAPRILGPSGAAAAYRRRSFLEVGGFAPEIFAYWEDADLALRFWARQWSCALALEAVADHARGTALEGRSLRQRELDAFGRGFILGRYRDWMSVGDRSLIPLLDWPSIVRGCYTTRSLRPWRARLEGRRVGRHRPVSPPPPGMRPVTRSVLRTISGQLGAFIGGTQDVTPDRPREPTASAHARDVSAHDR